MKCTFRSALAPTAIISLTLLCSALASATTYYVSTSGSNSNSGLNTSSAWRNIQYAADHVAAGDTVQVLGGTYNETVNIAVSGSAGRRLYYFRKLFRTNSRRRWHWLKHSGLSIPGNQFGLFNIASQSYVIIKGFEIRNYSTAKKKCGSGWRLRHRSRKLFAASQ